MANAYYSASGNPATGSEGLSALMRAEFQAISAGFDLLPVFTGNGNKAVVVNAGGTGLAVTTGTLALAGNFATTGAFDTTFAQGASVTLTLPVVSGTLATLAGTETLSNKTLVAPALGTPVSGVATNLTGTAAGLTAGNATNAVNATNATSATTATTATNVSGGTASVTTLAASSTVSGAGFTARFSAPGPIGDVTPSTAAFTTLAASSTVSGAGFTARFSTPGPIGDSSPSTGAFTTLSASSTVSGAGFTARFASPGAIGSTSASTGAFTTVSATGQITSTVSTGTAPFVVASTTNVANLNAATLNGNTFSAPGAIGGGTPNSGAFTAVTATTSVAGGTGAFTSLTASSGLTVSSGGASITGNTTITGIIGDATFAGTNTDPAGNAVQGLSIINGALSCYNSGSGGTVRIANNVGGTSPLVEFFNGVGVNVGSITTNGVTTAFNTTSDARLKIDDGAISPQWAQEVLARLTPKMFRWKAHADKGQEPGFFAQDVSDAFKWAVTEGYGKPGDKGFVPWQIDATKLIPVLVAVLQQLGSRVAELERKCIP